MSEQRLPSNVADNYVPNLVSNYTPAPTQAPVLPSQVAAYKPGGALSYMPPTNLSITQSKEIERGNVVGKLTQPSDMPPSLVDQIFAAEGSHDDSISPKGAVGRGQVMPATAAGYGVTPEQLHDPEINKAVAVRYMQDLWNQFHDPDAVKVAYNAGPEVAKKWLASGKNNAVLPIETQKYIGGRATGIDISGLSEEAQRVGQEQRAIGEQSLSAINKQMDRYNRLIDKAPPGSEQMDAALARQMELSERSAAAFDKLASEPPQYQPKTFMERLGGLGTVIAVLGGLKSRQPMTAALGAAGEAMQAINQNNYDNYKIAYNQWKTQSDLVVQSLKAHSESINQILQNKRLSIEERNAELNALATATQNEFLKAKLAQNDAAAPFQLQLQTTELAKSLEQLKLNIAKADENIALQRERVDLERHRVELAEAKYEEGTTPQQIELKTFMSDFEKAHGRKPNAEEIRTEILAMSRGSQSQAQTTALSIAGNEVSKSVANLVQIPITGTLGWFQGVQWNTPSDLQEAVRRSLAQRITPEESQAIKTSFSGVSRGLATLEAGGRATGLVGLSSQADALMPQPGNSQREILRKYAEIRQIVEAAGEAIQASPNIGADQKALVQKWVADTRKSVWWTVNDITQLEFAGAYGKGEKQSVADFADKALRAQKGELPETSSLPHVNSADEYNKLPPGSYYLDSQGTLGRKPEK